MERIAFFLQDNFWKRKLKVLVVQFTDIYVQGVKTSSTVMVLLISSSQSVQVVKIVKIFRNTYNLPKMNWATNINLKGLSSIDVI